MTATPVIIGAATLYCGDVIEVLKSMDAESVQCVVTSPPYWGLRDYGIPGMIGLEPTFQEWVDRMVAVCAEVRRVLRKDGTFWLNCGDAYATSPPSTRGKLALGIGGDGLYKRKWDRQIGHGENKEKIYQKDQIFKPKDLLMMPARLAIALQEAGWWVRSEIIWAKPNPMPESCTDRPTSSHEKIYLLTKSARYFYDADAVREDQTEGTLERAKYRPGSAVKYLAPTDGSKPDFEKDTYLLEGGRNLRNVWTIATQPLSSAVSYGTNRIMSPCCPVHGCQACLSRVPECDVLQAFYLTPHSLDNDNHPFQEQIDAACAIEPNPGVSLSDWFSAILHSIQSHKKVGELKPGVTYDDKSSSRIEYKQFASRSVAMFDHIPNYNTLVDFFSSEKVLDLLAQIPCCIEGRYKSDSFEIPPDNCCCNYTGNVEKRQDHFAAFPEALPMKCIMAGTSEKGCCPECGAPWVRVVEKQKPPLDKYTNSMKPVEIQPCQGGGGMGQKLQDWYNQHPPKTLGWKPSCECALDPIPCTVLDPFSGSATTGLVALKLNRRYIGIELNPDYVQLSIKRIQKEADQGKLF